MHSYARFAQKGLKMASKTPEKWMEEALLEAEKARAIGEVPIGCVIVQTEPEERIIARGHNETETSKDPTCHAEMIALREAAKALGGWRLPHCDMYVTLEPCPMCAGALVLSRIETLYIGASEPKFGACGSLYDIPEDARLNHRVQIERDILADRSAALMKDFFRSLRNKA